MDGYEHHDLDEIDFVPVECTAERLAALCREESEDLLELLQAGTRESGPPLSPEAHRVAREIAACIPSWN
jgi:hypothetical protein